MGSFSNVTGQRLVIMAVLCLADCLFPYAISKIWNVFLMGQSYAESLGLSTSRIRNRIFLATTLLAGSVTAFADHRVYRHCRSPLCRMAFGNANHRIMLPASALMGACLMLLADILSQMPGSQSVLPVNTVAALLGLPVILYVILKNKAVAL